MDHLIYPWHDFQYFTCWPAVCNTLRPRQNGHRSADDTLKCIFLNENVRISIKISLKFVPKGPINNNPALVRIMAWRRPGDKPLSETMMVILPTHICVTRPQWVNWELKGTWWPILCKNWHVNPTLTDHDETYSKTSNISGTQSQNLNVSHLVLQFS